MADLSAFEFARAVQDACHRSELVVSYEVQILDDIVTKMRIALTVTAFIDLFYNAETGKCAYALIENNRRIFGVDNAFVGWHIHPFDDPERHIPCEAVSFAEFLGKVEAQLS